jgi:hypothetical protein
MEKEIEELEALKKRVYRLEKENAKLDSQGKLNTANIPAITESQLAVGVQSAINLAHSNTRDHANTLDHSNTLDHNGGTQDTAISGKANSVHSHSPTDVTGTAVITSDPRLTDNRIPVAHNQSAETITTGTLDGDRLPSPTSTKKGGVPMTGTPSGKYLKDDGTWAVVSASVNWGGINGTLSNQSDLDTALGTKQPTLVSGTNIKTVNSTTLLGSGNLSVCPTPSWYGTLYSNQNDCNPNEVFREWNMLAVAAPTPTNITASLSRCVMFTPPANMTILTVRTFGIATTSALYKFAIYPVGTGSSKLWDSGLVSTAANVWNGMATSTAITAGTQYWFCVTVVNTGTTAGFRSMPAPLGTAFWGANAAPVGNRALSIPVFAQFAVSSGVFPATLPTIASAAYSGSTTGSVPFALLDSIS